MHIDFALPVDGDIAKGFKRYQEVSRRSVTDYGLHMAITTWNDKVRPSLSPCVAAVFMGRLSAFRLFHLALGSRHHNTSEAMLASCHFVSS